MLTTRTLILLTLDFPFLLLHISVVAFIICRQHKDFAIRSGFFTLFAITGVADITHQLVVRFHNPGEVRQDV